MLLAGTFGQLQAGFLLIRQDARQLLNMGNLAADLSLVFAITASEAGGILTPYKR
ncbi:MAG: hypothetical protein R2856_33725 [Caldilineaceae bacterium]